MKKKEIFTTDFLPNKQEKLFSYDQYFKLFIKLYKNNLLPNKILITGQSGIGKSTFIYHFINSILSNRENYSYDFENFSINSFNRSFRLVGQHCHPNFHLIKNIFLKIKYTTPSIMPKLITCIPYKEKSTIFNP